MWLRFQHFLRNVPKVLECREIFLRCIQCIAPRKPSTPVAGWLHGMNRRSPRRHDRRSARTRPGAQAPGRERERWSRPVSRVLYASRRDSHSSRPGVAAWLQQPTRGRRGPRQCPPIWSCSEWGLPCRTALAPYAVRSYRTLSPLPVPLRAIGGLLSVALAVGSRRPGVTWHSALWSPDFPRRACARRDCPADSASHCNGRGPGLGNRDPE